MLFKTNEEREKIKKGNGGGLYCIHSISQYLATNSYSKGQHGAKGENEVVNIAVFQVLIMSNKLPK